MLTARHSVKIGAKLMSVAPRLLKRCACHAPFARSARAGRMPQGPDAGFSIEAMGGRMSLVESPPSASPAAEQQAGTRQRAEHGGGGLGNGSDGT